MRGPGSPSLRTRCELRHAGQFLDVWRDFEGTAGAWHSISGFDLIILTLAVAIVVFHYWRFQDNSETQANI